MSELDLRDVYDFDIRNAERENFAPLNAAIEHALLGERVIIRVFEEIDSESSKVHLATISAKEFQPLITHLMQQGISKNYIKTLKSTSDQVLIIINDK